MHHSAVFTWCTIVSAVPPLLLLLRCQATHAFWIGNSISRPAQRQRWCLAVTVWVQDAEDDFVDHDENLEEGETCLRAIKAFADNDDGDTSLFLCAGALVRRPDSMICDAWMADSLESNANLQVQGAQLVLDELLWTHIRELRSDPLHALFQLRLQCGSMESQYTCASYMAATNRGFVPFASVAGRGGDGLYGDLVQQCADDDNWDGMVMDPVLAHQQYQQLLQVQANNERAETILSFLSNVVTSLSVNNDDDNHDDGCSDDGDGDLKQVANSTKPTSTTINRRAVQSYLQQRRDERAQ